MDAIYFVAPTKESVTRLADDITATKQMYAGGHVFFSGVLPDALHTQLNIAKRQNRPFVRIQRELALDFTMFESGVFLAETDDGAGAGGEHRDRGLNSQADVERMGSKIASVLLTLGSSSSSRRQPPPVGQSLSYLANAVSTQLSFLAKLDSEYQSASAPKPNRDGPATVVERLWIWLAGKVEEDSRESMELNHRGISTESQSQPGQMSPATESGSGDERVTLIMDESDEIWMDVKFDHIARVVPKVQKLLIQLRSEDPAMLAQSGNTANISRALMSLPKYTEIKKRLSSHISLLSAIQSALGRRRLVEVGSLEQDLVCIQPIIDKSGRAGSSLASLLAGLGAGGTARTWEDEIRQRMLEFLEDQDGCPDIDQLRLICIYAISRAGIPSADIAKFADIAKLLPEDVAAIHNLALYGARIVREDGVPFNPGLNYGRVYTEGKEKDHETDAEGNIITPLMKYAPILRTVMEDAGMATLPEDLFPVVRVASREEVPGGSSTHSPITMQSGGSLKSNPSKKESRVIPDDAITVELPTVPQAKTGFTTQLTVVKPTWAMKTSRDIPVVSGNSVAAAAEGDGTGGLDMLGQKSKPPRVTRGPRIVIFIVGGMTMGEVRCAEEVGAKMAREIVLGSTHILSPAQFIDSLKPINTNANPTPHQNPMITPSSSSGGLSNVSHLQAPLRRSGTGARMKTMSRQIQKLR
ncbi:hypothetical protein HDU93_003990 [Gonapodya sp. JEL0774]|nr:hypothetical protein HDU93_003990 [Gonapodya sp. JEL0774]